MLDTAVPPVFLLVSLWVMGSKHYFEIGQPFHPNPHELSITNIVGVNDAQRYNATPSDSDSGR